MNWLPISEISRPQAGDICAVVLSDGSPVLALCYPSPFRDEPGLCLDCNDAGIWNLDQDEDLPVLFCVLPPLPQGAAVKRGNQ